MNNPKIKVTISNISGNEIRKDRTIKAIHNGYIVHIIQKDDPRKSNKYAYVITKGGEVITAWHVDLIKELVEDVETAIKDHESGAIGVFESGNPRIKKIAIDCAKECGFEMPEEAKADIKVISITKTLSDGTVTTTKPEEAKEPASEATSARYTLADEYVNKPTESQHKTINALVRRFGNHNSLKPVLFETIHGHILEFDLRPDAMTDESYKNHMIKGRGGYRWYKTELAFLASLDLRWFEAKNSLSLSFGIEK